MVEAEEEIRSLQQDTTHHAVDHIVPADPASSSSSNGQSLTFVSTKSGCQYSTNFRQKLQQWMSTYQERGARTKRKVQEMLSICRTSSIGTCGKGRKLPQMPAIAASQGQVAMGQQQDPATAQIPADAMPAQVAELEGLADVSVAHCMHPPEISGYHGCSASHTSAATPSTSDLPQASTPDGKRRRRLLTANNVAAHAPVGAAQALSNSRHARKWSRPAHLQDFE